MAQNVFAAGSATALLFSGDNLIGVAKTLTDSSLEATISAEEIRAGGGNMLWGKYFHTSNLNVNLTDAMFNMEYFALALGIPIASGGVTIMEEQLVVSTSLTTLTLSETPVSFNGSIIGWYKKPTETEWTIGVVNGKTMTINQAVEGDKFCVKYYYQNPNVTSMTLKAQYVPSIIHVTLLVDLFRGSGYNIDPTKSTKAGRLIIDIPQVQMDGSQNLNLTSTTASTISLAGSALAIETSTECTTDPYYGTITQELFNDIWQNRVSAIAVANGDVTLSVSAANSEKLEVYALFKGLETPRQLDPAELTFTIAEGDTAASVDGQGLVTPKATGNAVVKVVITENAPANVDPAYAYVTVTA